jgi:hypothetical protein
MGAAKNDQWTETSNGATANDEWRDVETESQIVFDTIGDVFIGQYLGMDTTPDGKITQAHFKNADGEYFTNAGWDLRKKLANVPTKATVRMEWESELDTGKETPMRVYKVQYKS